jgi:hypothetical protein
MGSKIEGSDGRADGRVWGLDGGRSGGEREDLAVPGEEKKRQEEGEHAGYLYPPRTNQQPL